MSRKRKGKENLNQSHIELPKTFRELTQLTNTEINGLLRTLDLPVKQKSNHKLTTLATHLHIPTVGEHGDQDPFLQTLTDVKALTEGWTGDIRKVPEIRLESILKYLLAAHDIAACDTPGNFESYTTVSLKTYKALRAYDLWESGHISGFQFNVLSDVDGYCALKCVSNPSGDTSGTQYNVVIILKDCGNPIGGSCTCIAGLGEACTHIAGLMFGVEDFVSRGYKELPDCQSTTEKLCKWNVPKGPKVIPTQLCNVSVKKNVPGKVKKDNTFRTSEYNPVPHDQRSVDFAKLVQLHHDLGIVNPTLPWVKAVAPAIVDQHRPAVRSTSQTPPAATLPHTMCSENPLIIPAKTCEVNTSYHPTSIIDKIKVNPDSVISREAVSYSVDDCNKIEEVTRQQSNSPLWFKYRLGLITASKCQQVAGHVKTLRSKGPTSATDKLVETFVKGSKFKGNDATRYGQQQEPHAVDAYREESSLHHNNLHIHDSGLVISRAHPFLGASPDRIVTCDCHGQRLLEVKCPYTLTDSSRTIESMDFLDVSGDIVNLKSNGNTYYAQIQGQMGITDIHQCELIVWNGKRVVVVPVPFNQVYWSSLVEKLDTFHQDHVFPRLIINVRGSYPAPTKVTSILTERRTVQANISDVTNIYPCGRCGHLIEETVSTNHDASIQCECECQCKQWFHWRCVHYQPDPDNFDEEPAWFCVTCVRNCDIVM